MKTEYQLFKEFFRNMGVQYSIMKWNTEQEARNKAKQFLKIK